MEYTEFLIKCYRIYSAIAKKQKFPLLHSSKLFDLYILNEGIVLHIFEVI